MVGWALEGEVGRGKGEREVGRGKGEREGGRGRGRGDGGGKGEGLIF